MNNSPIEELDRRGYRNFALTFGTILVILFGLFFPWLLALRFPVWPWLFLLGLGLWGALVPMTLRPFYRIWMKFGLLLSKVTTPLILGVVYYGVITPTGLIARLFRSDPLNRNCEQECSSYRVESQPKPNDHMENPF
ncbi:sxtJ [Halieaceae bacterium IMCC8485]|uniref:SxtJ n=1 Tax=Candidatus Seongchinamella marina TaxID=2518990 RepID=A0ABT3SQQ7_9GAMM|nr:SxtJ family membrane protein [Candidatus Seongchinamella marina]MCX2972001.1 sxtJ [Candidatus Seongchinamella marina]